ncbi:hypothetical protein C8K36_10972 [Rhodococcus sp. OK519]|uniref:hypothetical protein n=1 Tax=Rhodococcus sp. OK519 TaxID=2135729 RepID=UPI000D3C28DD|nr:hypothetical protein C8K36_10972 [Rhodococcus sp. OK519]
MRKDRAYYSMAPGAESAYHVFTDCSIGARIEAPHRMAGIGPADTAYPRCALCEELDRMILGGRLWFHPRSGRARRSL